MDHARAEWEGKEGAAQELAVMPRFGLAAGRREGAAQGLAVMPQSGFSPPGLKCMSTSLI